MSESRAGGVVSFAQQFDIAGMAVYLISVIFCDAVRSVAANRMM